MDRDVLGRHIVLGAIAAVVCVALLGGIYFWYVLRPSTNFVDTNLNGVAPTPVSNSTSTLKASQRALQQSAASSAPTTASPAALQASQAALQKAAQNNKAAGGDAPSNSASSGSSAAQQTQLEASQQALEKAVQQSKGQ